MFIITYFIVILFKHFPCITNYSDRSTIFDCRHLTVRHLTVRHLTAGRQINLMKSSVNMPFITENSQN